MRLTTKEVNSLKSVLAEALHDVKYQVFLFGSRTDDLKKGGDIDLLLKISEDDFSKVYQMKSALRFELENAVGDQRVDLTLATSVRIEKDVFLQSIAADLVEL